MVISKTLKAMNDSYYSIQNSYRLPPTKNNTTKRKVNISPRNQKVNRRETLTHYVYLLSMLFFSVTWSDCRLTSRAFGNPIRCYRGRRACFYTQTDIMSSYFYIQGDLILHGDQIGIRYLLNIDLLVYFWFKCFFAIFGCSCFLIMFVAWQRRWKECCKCFKTQYWNDPKIWVLLKLLFLSRKPVTNFIWILM